jgi:hypothetical protein
VALPHQRIADGHQIMGRQVSGEVEEGLSARRQPQASMLDDVLAREPTAVDDDLGALGQNPPRSQCDVWARRTVDRGLEHRGGRPVAVCRVPWQYAGQEKEALALVDGVVQPDGEPVGEPDESGAPELTAGETEGSRPGRAEAGRK